MAVRLRKGVKKFSTRGLFQHGGYERSVDEFITIAKMRYGKLYTYERVVYRYSRTPVEITCPRHGPFSIAPDNFLKGQDCPRCRKEEFYPTVVRDNFIAKAEMIYGRGKYDYSLVRYNSLDDPIKIICPEHGPFKQGIQNHIKDGHGCPACGNTKKGEKRTLPFSEFLDRAYQVHGKKYQYIEASYTTLSNPVTIICPVHGEFRQNAEKHVMRRYGCPKCGRLSRGEKRAMPFSEFEKKPAKSIKTNINMLKHPI